jgi:hypothetical protein
MYFTKKSTWFFMFFSVVLAQESYANSYTVSCPSSIKVQQQISASYPSWRALSDQFHANGSKDYNFNGVSLYVDEPEKLVVLKPKFDLPHPSSVIWEFQRVDKIYIVCEYQDTSIQLTQPLSDHTTSCKVFFKKYISTERGPLPERIVCYKGR